MSPRESDQPAHIARIVAEVMRQLKRSSSAEPNGLLRPQEAADYLAISLRSLHSRADIPRVDIGAPGSARAMWRYRRADLDQIISMRTVVPFFHESAT
jgi:hypothetical protein